MKNIISSLVIFISLSSFSQGPPPEAVADSINMPLIIEVAASCHYELHYEHFKDSVVDQFAKQYGWGKEKIATIKKELVYVPINESRFFNAYAFYSKIELEKIKKFNLSLTKKQLMNLETITNKIIVHNMINSLDWGCKKHI